MSEPFLFDPVRATLKPEAATQPPPAVSQPPAAEPTQQPDPEPAPVKPAAPKVTTVQEQKLLALIAEAVGPLVKTTGAAPLDEKRVRELALETVMAHGTRTIQVQHSDGTLVKLDGLVHKQFPEILGYIAAGFHVYVHGGPGWGKTFIAAQIASALKRNFAGISTNETTPEHRLTGFPDVNGNYHPTPFRTVYETGGIFCWDEADNASGNVITTFNTGLENGHFAFPDKMVPRHKDFVLYATGNSAWRGGVINHTQRRAADAATLERFIFLRLEPDTELERKVALAYNKNAGPWIEWIQRLRPWAEKNSPGLVVSPRATYRLAALCEKSPSPTVDRLLESVLWKAVPDDVRLSALRNVPPPAGPFKAIGG